MYQQRSAARLLLRRNDFAAFGGENPSSGGIDLWEKFALYTTEQQTNPAALRAGGRRDLRNGFTQSKLRKQRFHRLHFLRQQLQQTQTTHDGLQSRFLIHEQRQAHSLQTIWPGKSLKHKSSMEFFSWGAFGLSFDLGACCLDEFSVVHAGRARGHASHAA